MPGFRVLTALALATLASAPSAAQMERAQQTFFTPDPSAPELANAYLEAHPGNAIEIVTYRQAGKDPADIYYSFGPVSRSRQGVCRFTAAEVFAHRAADGTWSWDSTPPNPADRVEPPTIMAAIAGTPCPRQSLEGYVSLDDGVSDPEFVALSKFLKEIAGSEEKFDSAAAYLPFILAPRVAEKFAAFRSSLLRPAGANAQLRAVLQAGVGGYDLAFADSPSGTPSMFLNVAKSRDGFQMLNFQGQF
jgi:hypothetical protein